MNKWNEYKLESVALLVSGRTPEREQKEYYACEGTPWVKIENLDQGFITKATEYLSEKGREKVNLVPKNSVLFSIVGTVGKVGIAGTELATNQQIVSLIFDEEKVLPLYGYYYLRYYAEEIKKLSNQTTMALISRKTLGQYRMRVPESLEVQQSIVDTLSKFENYARKKEALREQISRYESVLFWKMFAQELRFHEKLPLKEFLRESIGTGIPKGEEPEGDFPCIRANAFQKPYLEQMISQENTDISLDDSYRLQGGDVLVRNGRLFLAEKQEHAIYMERNILCIRTKSQQLLPEVLYGWLQVPEIAQTLYTERKAGESRKRPIRASELERMQIPYFSMEKQKEFARFLKKIRQIQRSLDQEIIYAWKVFQAAAFRCLEQRKLDIKEKKQESEAIIEVSEEQKEDVRIQIARLILAVLCGWSPKDERTGQYCQARREIFRKAQPYFQPVAFSLAAGDIQEEYLLVRDFLTYHSAKICEEWENPLEFLKSLLNRGSVPEAHLAFQGEHGISTDADWSEGQMKEMAKEGLLLLTVYSGLEACSFLTEG